MERRRLRAVALATLALLVALVGFCVLNGDAPCPPGLRAHALAAARDLPRFRLEGEPVRIACTATGIGTWRVEVEGQISTTPPFGTTRTGHGRMWIDMNQNGVVSRIGGTP